ncbi:MAG: pirin family protein, partial [Chloroflexota bacterium]
SIPLEGDLEHNDSMGNNTVISQGEVQVMSAGTGIRHSEYNKNPDRPVKFLQIWVFPKEKGVKPRYGQIRLNSADRFNKLQQIVSPDPEDEGVWIHQDAWFNLGTFEPGKTTEYRIHNEGNGVYIFVLKGSVIVNETELSERDGFGIWDTEKITFISNNQGAEVLVMEVPMY